MLKLELVSSRKVEEANTLSIQLKDGSATCKLNILFYHVIQTEIVHVLFQIAVLSVIVILLYVTAILHSKL